uniref:Lipid-binding serum glycoprotein N-terminal domain-containing protein n=1 Tax=Junco hyemalis TaxID=40217 RepID=A0A8C5NRT5_JUNHY
MKVLKLFGIIFFCGLLSPSQEVLSGLSCAVSPRAMQNGNYKKHLQVVFALKALWGVKLPEFYSPSSLFHNSSGLHLIKVRVPRLSVVLLPGIGVQLTIGAKLQLRGNCLVGLLSELIDILVEVNITANIKCTNFESGTFQVVTEDCLSVIPVGTAGTIHYQLASIPYTSGKFLGLDLDGVVKQVGGSTIPHDSSPSALPPLMDRLLLLVMRQSFLNAVLSLLLQLPPQTFPCTPDVFSGASRLREAMRTMAPAGCSACSGTSPLSIKLVLRGNPLILLEENKASVKLSVLIQLFGNHLDGSILNFLLLKADLALNVRVSIVGGRLMLAAHVVVPSLIQISTLKPHCSNLLVETFMPAINGKVTWMAAMPGALGVVGKEGRESSVCVWVCGSVCAGVGVCVGLEDV